MNSNGVILIFIIIILAATAVYLATYFLKKKNQDQLDALEKRKEALVHSPVIQHFEGLRERQLFGQSLETLDTFQEKWDDLIKTRLPELENELLQIESNNESFHFKKVQNGLKKTGEYLDEMEKNEKELQTSLQSLDQLEDKNSQEISETLKNFDKLKAKAEDAGKQYGPALPELQKQIGETGRLFQRFHELNSTGDPLEAQKVLTEAQNETEKLTNMTEQIAPLYHELSQVFPGQLDELHDSYEKMTKEYYVFPQQDFSQKIDQIRHGTSLASDDLAKLQLNEVVDENREIAERIDQMYDRLEKEYAARNYVMNHREQLADFLNHATKNNRQLMIELDHISQSYVLNHNELGDARGFQTQLEGLSRQNDHLNERLKSQDMPYSEIEARYKDMIATLEEIETHQVEIDRSMKDMTTGEEEANQQCERFEFKLRSIKRHVDKWRLPGLTEGYLDYFFVATDRVEALDHELKKIRVNMDNVNELVDLCKADIELVTAKTIQMVDAANLTEQMLQYANRYRHTHEEIKEAIEHSLFLFEKQFRYEEALSTIKSALDKVEPGATARIEKFYYENRESLDF